MRITASGRRATVVIKLLSLSLSLLAAQPASAQVHRNSPPNAGVRFTPLPTPTAKPTAIPKFYNSCFASVYESASGGVPYTGVCEREWVAGKYVCRHHARDFCENILRNGSNQAMGSGCWGVRIGFDRVSRKDIGKQAGCAAAACGVTPWVAIGNHYLSKPLFDFDIRQITCTDKQRECVESFSHGHAINIFRSEGKDALNRGYDVTFTVVEPQRKNGADARICSWTQKTLEPEIPDDCKQRIIEEYFSEQSACGLTYEIVVLGFDAFTAEVERQDRRWGFPTPQP